MGLNKKAFFYTMMGLLLGAYVITIYAPSVQEFGQNHEFAVLNRIESMDVFIDNYKRESEKAVHVGGFRSIIALLQEVLDSGEYIDDVELTFEELMLNGTIDNDSVFIMSNNTLPFWIDNMKYQASQVGINLNISIVNISIKHKSPWSLDVSVYLNSSLEDMRGLVSWNILFEASSSVSILELLDPMYIVETNNQYVRSIYRSPYEDSLSNSTLDEHIDGKYYVAFDEAPSYLNRLEGKTTSSEHGIESLIDKNDLSFVMAVDFGKTNVGYIYFSSDDPVSYAYPGIPGVDNDFMMDNETDSSGVGRLKFYGLE